jgi:DNA-binding beta-propeller fold protein YncE
MSPTGRILMILGVRPGLLTGSQDSKDGFNQPTNVAFRANGDLYISDGYINSRVVEYTPDGYYVRQWGRRGKGDGEFNLVHDVVVDSRGLVYVADRANERIQVFDPDGTFLAKWTGYGSPWGICFYAKENAIYMCDGKYDRICKFSLDGKLLGTLSAFGRGPGKVDYVHDIAVDPADGSLYTAEIKTWRVQKWVRTK